MCSHVQSYKLVHVSGIHCHTPASSTSGFAIVYFTVQYCIEYGTFISSPGCLEASLKATVMQLVLLYFSRYCTVRLKCFLSFLCLFFMYYLCEKYYKPITVQYYITDCVSWVPRLTLLDLRTNWSYKRALGTELVCMQGTYCIYLK